MRTVFWDYERNSVKLIDQRLLPFELVIAEFEDYREVARSISEMYVRGAPAIGATAAFGMALAARQSSAAVGPALYSDLLEASEILNAARPTAVNLSWATSRQLRLAKARQGQPAAAIRQDLLQEAQRIADDDVALNRRMGFNGAELISDGDTILHHCNTGALATVDWGTALGVIFAAHEQGKRLHVLVDETRPRLQGARLTAWELKQRGVSFDLIADNAAGHFMRTGQVDIVLVGSDRTAANGDVANKIGTYKLAVVAKENGIPFYPVVPTSTVDLNLANGDLIPIEERPDEEVLNAIDRPLAPEGVTARNPAFDVTPHRYVTGIVTEAGIVYPPFVKNLHDTVTKEQSGE
ncbi:MAG TPA: S-methyl-5-thioribose-1-phosphate isomerase [Anaerolineae bacterium]|jgi:methylthioribose-1-phosphate isomerase|nr:S-methyl-5-thioribose-1-phosphate isomerase [Anaerolineae bacterium]